jgi:hypothetical protein
LTDNEAGQLEQKLSGCSIKWKKNRQASVTGYCIRFKLLKELNMDIFESAVRDGVEASNDAT